MSMKIQTNLPDKAYEELTRYADATGMSLSSAARDLLLRALEGLGLWPPKVNPNIKAAAA